MWIERVFIELEAFFFHRHRVPISIESYSKAMLLVFDKQLRGGRVVNVDKAWSLFMQNIGKRGLKLTSCRGMGEKVEKGRLKGLINGLKRGDK